MKLQVVDKWRFCDTEADSHKELVHSIEISDNYVTVYVKENKDDSIKAFLTEWTKANGLDQGSHDPHTYHREAAGTFGPQWVHGQYPHHRHDNWTVHYHQDLKRKPTLKALEKYFDQVPLNLQKEIKEHYKWKDASPNTEQSSPASTPTPTRRRSTTRKPRSQTP